VGRDVVVILSNDNWFRVPAYSGAVLAVLRNNQAFPYLPRSYLWPPTAAGWIGVGNFLRILAERATHNRRHRRFARRSAWPTPSTRNVIEIPLGYQHQPPLPVKPFAERQLDAYFGGSLSHALERGGVVRRTLKRFVNPKEVFRRSLVDAVKSYVVEHPQVRIKLHLTGDSKHLNATDAASYGEDMMDARLALVPRGTALESYRLFEAWRYGCVPVCEPLPRGALYDLSPRVTVTHWRDLKRVLDELLADPMRQQALHEASLRWWRDVCSEEAVGQRLIHQLASFGSGTRLLGDDRE
jgi:hypothetical protein